MRRFMFLVMLAGVAGCDAFGSPRFDTSSEAAFKTSYFEVTEGLASAQADQLKQALLKIALAENGTDFSALDGNNAANPFAGLAKVMMTSAMGTVANDPDKLAVIVVRDASDVVSGKTAEEVIRYSAGEGIDLKKDELRRLRKQSLRLDREIADAESEILAIEKVLVPKRDRLSRVEIRSSRYRWHIGKYGFDDKPVISFRIKNGSDVAISKIFMMGVLESPGRSIPWLKESINYQLKGGLEPGEEQALDLAPNSFGPWGDKSLKDRSDTILTITVEDVELADGTRMIGLDESTKSQDLRKRIDGLKAARPTLIEKISQSERDLGVRPAAS